MSAGTKKNYEKAKRSECTYRVYLQRSKRTGCDERGVNPQYIAKLAYMNRVWTNRGECIVCSWGMNTESDAKQA